MLQLNNIFGNNYYKNISETELPILTNRSANVTAYIVNLNWHFIVRIKYDLIDIFNGRWKHSGIFNTKFFKVKNEAYFTNGNLPTTLTAVCSSVVVKELLCVGMNKYYRKFRKCH